MPLGQVKIARDPGSTTITPYMASGGVISLAAYMVLEAKRKARASAVQATKTFLLLKMRPNLYRYFYGHIINW